MSFSPSKPILIVVLGHTAGGKTAFAARLAKMNDGEIISADSRQVYRGMDIGTGKDYEDYVVDGKVVRVHLIDIVDAGYEYNVFEFQKDFVKAFRDITQRGKLPFLCGGTGLYLQAVLKAYEMINVPHDEELRFELATKSTEELVNILSGYKNLHNTTDTLIRKRLIRAIEIEEFKTRHPEHQLDFPAFTPLVIGIKFEVQERRKRITERLKTRLEGGMVSEAENLLSGGVPIKKLEFYGLEYKYLAWYLSGKISYDQMFESLNTAIHQFAKRQMTWFRKMEREGIKIHWIEGGKEMDEKLEMGMQIIGRYCQRDSDGSAS